MSTRASLLPRTLRGRLVLWVGLILALVLALFSGAVYALLDRGLGAQVEDSLAARARQVAASYERAGTRNGGRGFGGRGGPGPGRDAGGAFPPPPAFASADTVVQVADPSGAIVRAPFEGGERTLPLRRATLAAVRAGRAVYETVRVDGERVGLYSAPVVIGGRVALVVQAGRGLGFVEQGLGRLRLLAGLGLLMALGVSVLGVWLMTGRTLRPLARLARTAEGIGLSRDLSRRVAAPSPDDEVGRLSITFNGMLTRLQASDAQLREALESQRRFVADASHELRTPLTAIRGNAGMLRQVAELSPRDRAEALEEIHREAERMSRLVGDLLTLARADAGRPLRHEAVELAGLAREVAAQAARTAAGRRIEVEAPDPAGVAGDPDALRQLALILLDNAVKHTPPGGRVAVRVERRGGEARLVVADTGEGIAPEHLPHIFERFYRADAARTQGGTGLGLAIARWITERHGGTIEVESAPGRGSTFSVALPADSAGSAAAAPSPATVARAASTTT